MVINEIWYLRSLIALPGYQIEWQAIEGKGLITIILLESVPFQKLGHMFILLSD